jgi:hypothetical protein
MPVHSVYSVYSTLDRFVLVGSFVSGPFFKEILCSAFYLQIESVLALSARLWIHLHSTAYRSSRPSCCTLLNRKSMHCFSSASKFTNKLFSGTSRKHLRLRFPRINTSQHCKCTWAVIRGTSLWSASSTFSLYPPCTNMSRV